VIIRGALPEALRGQRLSCVIQGQRHQRTLTVGRFEWEMPTRVDAFTKVEIQIAADTSICPRRDLPGSLDERALSFVLTALELG
jgi:hypothetical protein